MREEFTSYLDGLDLPPSLRSHVENLYVDCEKTCPEQIEDVLISEYLTPEGTRFESLDCFSSGYHVFAYIMRPESAVTLFAISGRVKTVTVTKKDYDWIQATEASRISVQADTVDGTALLLKASGPNCDHLREIFERHIQQNLVDRDSPSRGTLRISSGTGRTASKVMGRS